MNTKILSAEKAEDIALAGEILRQGGLVAIPTETVYGLAANALDPKAVKKIYEAKGRPGDNPLIVHISDFAQLLPLVKEVPEKARRLAAAFWPGPLTMIFQKTDRVPAATSGGLNTVAVRFPENETACQIITAAGFPLAAPSANLSGKPSPTAFRHVREDLSGRVEAIVDGGDCRVGLESTVLSLTGEIPCVLRPGGVTVEALEEVIGPVQVDPAVLHRLEQGRAVTSPGMKYKHYAPKAQITVAELSFQDFQSLFSGEKEVGALCFEGEEKEIPAPAVIYGQLYDSSSQARGLFTALHTLDELGMKTVYARAPQKRGVGLAVYNRLIRAAGFRVLVPPMHVLGLTGQTGAGKSTVAHLLQALGAVIIDCDAVTREADTYLPCMKELQQVYGSDILCANGSLDRKKLANRAFRTPALTAELNRITLPVIKEKISRLVETQKKQGTKILVLDAPTLFEAKADGICDKILAVTAPEHLRKKRIVKRDGITEEQAALRMAAQKPEEHYVNRADWVIQGNGEEGMRQQLERIFKELG